MSGYYGRSYYDAPKSFDPCPRGGLAEHIFCGLRARYGAWPKDFLDLVDKYYGGRIPARLQDVAARMQRDRFWEGPDDEHTGLPPTITIVNHKGVVLAKWRPTAKEWEDAKP